MILSAGISMHLIGQQLNDTSHVVYIYICVDLKKSLAIKSKEKLK